MIRSGSYWWKDCSLLFFLLLFPSGLRITTISCIINCKKVVFISSFKEKIFLYLIATISIKGSIGKEVIITIFFRPFLLLFL